MNVCRACGTRVDDSDVFCPDCGARLDTELKSPQEKRLHLRMLGIGAWVALLIFALVIIRLIGSVRGKILFLILLLIFTWTPLANSIFAVAFHRKAPLWLKILTTIVLVLLLFRFF